MIRILAISIPIVLWGLLLVLISKAHYRKDFCFFLLTFINFVAIWQLTQFTAGDYLWWVLLAAAVSGGLVAWLVIIDEHDLLFRRYWHWLSRVLTIASTCWWLAAIFFSK
ncbi:hypothetical protein [Lacticaseibacillus sp. GG6-2]